MWEQYRWSLREQRRDRIKCQHATTYQRSNFKVLQSMIVLTKFVATIVSKDSGFNTILQVIASTSMKSTSTSGNSFATSFATSSHRTMPLRCALLLVTTVSILRGRFWAVSYAKRRILVTACRVKIDTSVAVSHASPRCERPPCPAYSPSLFSRTITQSRSLQSRRGDLVPRKTLVGLTFAYC